MNADLNAILQYLNEKRGFDFSGYRPGMLERRITQRLSALQALHYDDYLQYLKKCPGELENLVDVLTINLSLFFRNALTFEYIADKILPFLLHEKKQGPAHGLRIWSAGCAMGEEPYSMAILIREALKKETVDLTPHIFATDIDVKVLKKAKEGIYTFERIQSVKYRHLIEYFTIETNAFELIPEIRKMVTFSSYDMLDNKSHAPPDSIYGHFDMVLCRNLLIYYDMECQKLIFEKLYRSLAPSGYLVLGNSETPFIQYQKRFKRVTACGHVYQKI